MGQILTEVIEYYHGDTKLIGFLAYPNEAKDLPAILVVHDWAGLNEVYKQRAIELAEQGYVAFAVDMYGDGRVGETIEERQALMSPLVQNRPFLRERVQEGLNCLKKISFIDKQRMGAIGFCFGGLCVLDLARMGTDILGVVSFHGLLSSTNDCPAQMIKASILICHGYDDPMVLPHDVINFCEEMKQLKASFQINMYSHTQHAFTNPLAHDEILGTVYQPDTAKKSFLAMHVFFKELFECI